MAERDQAGKITRFAYDSVGNLTSVTDPMQFVTSYEYDESDNRISQTDANLHTTTMDHDELGRMVRRKYPNGDTETFGYDANGNMLCKVDGNPGGVGTGGDSTVYIYDSRNREVFRRYTNSGNTVETRYTAPAGGNCPQTTTAHPSIQNHCNSAKCYLFKTRFLIVAEPKNNCRSSPRSLQYLCLIHHLDSQPAPPLRICACGS